MKINIISLGFLCLAALYFTSGNVEAASTEISVLVAPCMGCHGKDGASQIPHIPIIGGLSSLYSSDAIAAFREKTRLCDGDVMCQLASNISEEDAMRIGDYFASKPFVRAKQTFDPVLANQGKDIYTRYCNKCHQDGGSIQQDDAGILAGQWKPYLQQQFKEFKSGKRLMPEMMKPKIDKLSDADIKALIEYFASFN